MRRLPPDAAGLVPALVAAAEPYFRAEWISGDAQVTVPAGFAVVVVLEGDGRVSSEAGDLDVRRGDVALVPHAAGRWELHGGLRGVLCRPPAPDAPPAPR